MKKNTTIFDSLIDELFNMLNEVESNKQDKELDDERLDCEHCKCHCHNEAEDEEDTDDNKLLDKLFDGVGNEEDREEETYTPNFDVLSYTDEDFKDKEKLEEYVDELENLLLSLENMDEDEAAIMNYVAKCADIDVVSHIEGCIDHAYKVYNDSVKAKQKAQSTRLKTSELASRYVDEVFAKNFHKMGGKLTSAQISAMKNQFTAFADWVLVQ